MTKNPIMNMVKGAAVGMAAGWAVGYASKKAFDRNPKMKRKANKALHTMESMLDTAQYMFK